MLYRWRCHRNERRSIVVFLSRKAEEPSYDFRTLAAAFRARGWDTRMHLQNIALHNFPSYVKHVIREIDLLSKCSVVIMDRYDPIISLTDFDCESHPELAQGDKPLHTDFPVNPLVIQIWHAFGAFKKFGYQSVGTPEGHTREVTNVFNIHRNYSWIVCSGENCREAFADAFRYPVERVLPLNRPEYNELLAMGNQLTQQQAAHSTKEAHPSAPVRILFAPTLRKSRSSKHPFRDLYRQRFVFEKKVKGHATWSFHPLESNLPAPGNVSAQLLSTDLVVTDYSSIVYEAYLLRKPVLFFIPDFEDYEKSPGLNSDPTVLCPELCIIDPDKLASAINRYTAHPDQYPWEAFNRFAAGAFDEEGEDPLDTIVNLAIGEE